MLVLDICIDMHNLLIMHIIHPCILVAVSLMPCRGPFCHSWFVSCYCFASIGVTVVTTTISHQVRLFTYSGRAVRSLLEKAASRLYKLGESVDNNNKYNA